MGKKHGIKFFKHNVSLTILTTVHPRAAAAALSPQESVSRNFQLPVAPYKFRSLATPQGDARVSDEKTRFPLRGSAAYAAKGCTGWSVAMTRCCRFRPPNGGLLTDAVINDSYCSTPLRHCVALSPRESVSRNFQSPMAPYKFRSLATPQGGARVSGAFDYES